MQPKIHISLCTSHILVQIYNLAMVYNWCPKNFLYVILLNAVVLLIITLSAHVMYLAYYGISSWCFHPFFPGYQEKMTVCLCNSVWNSELINLLIFVIDENIESYCYLESHWGTLLATSSQVDSELFINNAWREDQLETQPISFILVIFFLRVM